MYSQIVLKYIVINTTQGPPTLRFTNHSSELKPHNFPSHCEVHISGIP